MIGDGERQRASPRNSIHRWPLGRFLPRRPEVQVEKHPDGSVTLRPVKRRMTPAEAEAFVRSGAGTWEGPISGIELLRLTRGA